jgi:histidine triad (HIT) family protein
MTRDNSCIFCRPAEIKYSLPGGTPCRRDIYEDGVSFALLSPEQYTAGHTLLILKNHKADITDDLSETDLSTFFSAIHKVAARLKKLAQNDCGEHPEKIYVCILCDGEKHLHAHLIPRYPFTQQDTTNYKTIFTTRDGEAEVAKAIATGDLGGYWYIAEREKHYKDTEFGRKSDSEKASILEELAGKLRTSG